MENELSIAFIGGGDRAASMASGQAGKVCAARDIHVIDINQHAHAASRAWQDRATTTRMALGKALAPCRAGVFAVKPRNINGVVASTRHWRKDVLSAAGGRSRDRAGECGK